MCAASEMLRASYVHVYLLIDLGFKLNYEKNHEKTILSKKNPLFFY